MNISMIYGITLDNFGLTSIVSVKVVNTSNHGFKHPPYSLAELGEKNQLVPMPSISNGR